VLPSRGRRSAECWGLCSVSVRPLVPDSAPLPLKLQLSSVNERNVRGVSGALPFCRAMAVQQPSGAPNGPSEPLAVAGKDWKGF
jgi:hypothetical protein